MPPDDSILILAAVTSLAVTTVVAEVATGNAVSFRPVLSAGVVGIFLSAIDFVAPQVARAFCGFIILVAFLRNGSATLNALSNVTKG